MLQLFVLEHILDMYFGVCCLNLLSQKKNLKPNLRQKMFAVLLPALHGLNAYLCLGGCKMDKYLLIPPSLLLALLFHWSSGLAPTDLDLKVLITSKTDHFPKLLQ